MLYYKRKKIKGEGELMAYWKRLEGGIEDERRKITPIPAEEYPNIYRLAFKEDHYSLDNFFLLCGRLKGVNPYKLTVKDMEKLEWAWGYFMGSQGI